MQITESAPTPFYLPRGTVNVATQRWIWSSGAVRLTRRTCRGLDAATMAIPTW
jgi:hypothetical protein